MKYLGSKARFAKEILPIILKDRCPDQWYVEPFSGGMNTIYKVGGKRIANDIHYYLIEMWKELVKGWIPQKITKKEYSKVKENQNGYPAYFVGWVGFNCSYSGKWFGGFAGETLTSIGTIRDYQTEAINNVTKQVEGMKGVIFKNKPYYELELPLNSIVYCDPPYQGTTKHKDTIDHDFFWNWVKDISKQGHSVYVSEYNAPNNFECVWSKLAKSSLSATGLVGGNKESIEKLFRYKHRNLLKFKKENKNMAVRIISTKNYGIDGVKVLVYGPAGIGKTTLASTAPDPLIISVEGGLLSLAEKDVPAIEVTNTAEVNEAYSFINNSDEAKQYQTICLDSISDIAERMLIEYKAQYPDGRQAYGALNDDMAKLLRDFRDIKGKHVYFTAKQLSTSDEGDEDGLTKRKPLMPGKTLLNSVSYLFDEVFVMRIGKLEEGVSYRYLQTFPDLSYDCKDRSGKLPKQAKPDLSWCFDLIMKGVKGEKEKTTTKTKTETKAKTKTNEKEKGEF